MAIPINTLSNGVINPTIAENLAVPQTFVLASNQKTLIIVNASQTETAIVLLKGTRDTINLPTWGEQDISEGFPVTLAPTTVATLIMELMYKHLGENGDVITVSSDSTEKDRVMCWLSE